MGFISAVCGAIGGALSAIGGALAGALAALSPAGLIAVCSVIITVVQALGLVPKEEDPEKKGEKILQAKEHDIKQADDEKYCDFSRRIDKFQVDPDKHHTKEECLCASASLYGAMYAEKNPASKDLLFAFAKNGDEKFFQNVDRFQAYANAGADITKAIGQYLNGTAKTSEVLGVAQKAMVDIEKQMNPSLSDRDALKTVMSQHG